MRYIDEGFNRCKQSPFYDCVEVIAKARSPSKFVLRVLSSCTCLTCAMHILYHMLHHRAPPNASVALAFG